MSGNIFIGNFLRVFQRFSFDPFACYWGRCPNHSQMFWTLSLWWRRHHRLRCLVSWHLHTGGTNKCRTNVLFTVVQRTDIARALVVVNNSRMIGASYNITKQRNNHPFIVNMYIARRLPWTTLRQRGDGLFFGFWFSGLRRPCRFSGRRRWRLLYPWLTVSYANPFRPVL